MKTELYRAVVLLCRVVDHKPGVTSIRDSQPSTPSATYNTFAYFPSSQFTRRICYFDICEFQIAHLASPPNIVFNIASTSYSAAVLHFCGGNGRSSVHSVCEPLHLHRTCLHHHSIIELIEQARNFLEAQMRG